MKTFPTQLISQPAAALKQSATRSAIKQLLTSSLIALIFTAGLALSASRIGAGGLAHEAAPKPKRIDLARMSEEVTIHAAGRGNPWINLSDGREVITPYSGEAELTRVLEQKEARALSLCSADFDEDGVPDLISGYAGPNGGIVTLLRGNVDSIYPNAPEAQQRRAEGTFTDAPFLSPAFAFGLPEAADFIGAGDFDGDSHWDVVVAARGRNALYLLSGDGTGRLSQTMRMDLPGDVTAMVVGEINRRDGLDDVVVGISGVHGPKALVFEGPEGALKAKPEAFSLPAGATSMALGQLDDEYTMDLAIAAGHKLVVIHGRDRKTYLPEIRRAEVKPATISQRSFPFAVKTIAIGEFSGNHQSDIAMLSKAGSVHLLSQPVTSAKAKARQSIAKWKSEELCSRKRPASFQLVAARISGSPEVDLVVVDAAHNQLQVLPGRQFGAGRVRATKSSLSSGSNREAVSVDVEGEAVAVMPMRLNKDALGDMVLLRNGQSAPTVALTAPASTYTVNSTGDDGDSIPGDGICDDGMGNCTLRAAIEEANANPGADTIHFSIGSGVQVIIMKDGAFPFFITDTTTIDGTTQPDFPGTPIVQLSAEQADGFRPSGLIIVSNSCLVRGLAIDHFLRPEGIPMETGIEITGAGNIVEGNFIGLDVSGTTGGGISFAGVAAGGSNSNNVVGGTASQARNVISNCEGVGAGVSGSVIGNFIGTDVTGTIGTETGNRGLSNGVGVAGGSTTIIGGSTAGSRNVISGNEEGVFVTENSLVQGNFIGTDHTGTHALGNVFGIAISGPSSGLTVGGSTSNTRNIISGNSGFGVGIGFVFDPTIPPGATGALVQGNFIGTDVTGTLTLPNITDGIFVELDSLVHTIRDNRIAFNGGNGVNVPNATSQSGQPGIQIFINSNSIYSNHFLGIDLGDSGLTTNDIGDGDGGANLQQNFPTLTGASSVLRTKAPTSGEVVAASTSTIRGVLNSTPNKIFTVEFFFGSDCGGSGHQFTGSIPVFLGSIQVGPTDANGDAPFEFTVTLPGGASSGFVNCTATDPVGNTSEFSECFQVDASPCSYQLSSPSPPSFLAGGGSGTVTVTTRPDCSWTASSNAPWIRITSSDSSGIGVVRYSVDPNTGPPRTGTMTIAGQAFTVTQSGLDTGSCSPICPLNQNALATSPTGAPVTYTTPSAPAGCSGVTVACSPPSGSTFPIGTTTVACTASDAVAAKGACSFSVTVTAPAITDAFRDKKKLVVVGLDFGPGAELRVNDAKQKKSSNDAGNPTTRLIAKKAGKKIKPGDRIQVINPGGVPSNVFVFCTPICPANQTAVATSSDGAVVSYTAPTPQSGCSGVNVTCSPASGSTFPIGTTTVTCTASSGSVLSSTCTFTVTVTPSAAPLTNVMRDSNNLKVGESPQRATNRRPKQKTPD